MGRLRDALSRLRREMRGELERFELRDGIRHFYEPMQVHREVFLHGIKCQTADSLEDWPEPPEVYVKMCEARDPAAVLERLTSPEFVDFPYEVDALLNERSLVPLPHEPVPDLSE